MRGGRRWLLVKEMRGGEKPGSELSDPREDQEIVAGN